MVPIMALITVVQSCWAMPSTPFSSTGASDVTRPSGLRVAVTRRGRSFRPRLVTATRSPDGRVTSLAPVEEKGVEGIAQQDWTTVIKAMMGTMTYGTGHIAFAKAAYSAGGKTGTAQVYTVAQNAKYNAKTVTENHRDHAWFVAFAP